MKVRKRPVKEAPAGWAFAFFGTVIIVMLGGIAAVAAAAYFGTDALCAWLDEDSTAAICQWVR